MSIINDPTETREQRELREEKHSRRMMWMVGAILAVVVITVVAVTGFHFQDSATFSAQRDSQARLDCSRKYSDVRTELRDGRDNLLSQVIASALTQPVDLTVLHDLTLQLQGKVAELKKLPSLSSVVAKNCPSV